LISSKFKESKGLLQIDRNINAKIKTDAETELTHSKPLIDWKLQISKLQT
jgi:hypothetical protein